jgi:hypothetical protein
MICGSTLVLTKMSSEFVTESTSRNLFFLLNTETAIEASYTDAHVMHEPQITGTLGVNFRRHHQAGTYI